MATEEKVKIKRGRPIKENAKRGEYRLRLDEETIGQLQFVSEATGMTWADIFRKGVLIQYNLAEFSDGN